MKKLKIAYMSSNNNIIIHTTEDIQICYTDNRFTVYFGFTSDIKGNMSRFDYIDCTMDNPLCTVICCNTPQILSMFEYDDQLLIEREIFNLL